MIVFGGEAFWKDLGHEDKALMNRITVVIKRSQGAPAPLLSINNLGRMLGHIQLLVLMVSSLRSNSERLVCVFKLIYTYM